MRDNAQDADLPRWDGGRRDRALSTSAATAAAPSAANGELSGRIDSPGRRDLPASAAAAASTPGAPFGRTRRIFNGRRNCAGRHLSVARDELGKLVEVDIAA
jgi:hypothetical protein